MDLFDKEAVLADATDRMRRFMIGVFSADRIDSERKTGPDCDACGVEVLPSKHIYRIGIYIACGPCAILAADKIKQLVALRESENGSRLPSSLSP